MEARFTFVMMSLVGQKVKVTTRDKGAFIGIFHASVANAEGLSIILKYAYQATAGGARMAPQSKLVIKGSQVVSVAADNVEFSDAGSVRAAGMTDTAIAGASRGAPGARELERLDDAWLLNGTEDDDFGGLEEGGRSKGSKGWDQFRVNRDKFGVESTFVEDDYTTRLDKGRLSREEQERARRIAREIEGTKTRNLHIAEERGHAIPNDERDEEDKYSGVLAEGRLPKRKSGAYIPPHERAKHREAAPEGRAEIPRGGASKGGPPGFSGASPAPAPAAAAPEADSAPAPTPAPAPGGAADDGASGEEPTDASGDKKPIRSKLNANAKVFNPKAKPFVPRFGGGATTAPVVAAAPPRPPFPGQPAWGWPNPGYAMAPRGMPAYIPAPAPGGPVGAMPAGHPMAGAAPGVMAVPQPAEMAVMGAAPVEGVAHGHAADGRPVVAPGMQMMARGMPVPGYPARYGHAGRAYAVGAAPGYAAMPPGAYPAVAGQPRRAAMRQPKRHVAGGRPAEAGGEAPPS